MAGALDQDRTRELPDRPPHDAKVRRVAVERQPSTLIEPDQGAPPEPNTVSGDLVAVPSHPGQDLVHLLDRHGLGSHIEHGRSLPVRREAIEASVAEGSLELLLAEWHIVARQHRLRRRLWHLRAGWTQARAPGHVVQLRRRKVETEPAVWIAIDGLSSVPRLLDGQRHVTALGSGACIRQPLGDLLDGHRPSSLEERHHHQVEQVDLVPAQHVLDARHGGEAEPLAVSVAHGACVAAADHRPRTVLCLVRGEHLTITLGLPFDVRRGHGRDQRSVVASGMLARPLLGPAAVRLLFDGGTILLRDAPEGVDLSDLLGCLTGSPRQRDCASRIHTTVLGSTPTA